MSKKKRTGLYVVIGIVSALVLTGAVALVGQQAGWWYIGVFGPQVSTKEMRSMADLPGVGAKMNVRSQALTREQMEEDFDYLWRMLEEEYPLYGTAERLYDKDYQVTKEAYREKLAELENDAEFCKVIERCIESFRGCGHLKMLNTVSYRDLRQLYYEIGIEGGNRHCAYLYHKLNNTASGVLYGYPKDAELTETSNGTDTEDGSNTSGQEPQVSTQIVTEIIEEGKIAYVKIASFGNHYIEADREALSEFFAGLEGYETCIIDIRGNGGGATNYWSSLLVAPNIEKTLKWKSYLLVNGEQSAEYEGLEYQLHPITELDTEALPALNTEDLVRAESYIEMDFWIRPERNGAKSNFTGDFYVLVDDAVYSASEAFASFCKATGFATLVGTTTGGDGVGIDPMVVVLPHSGICLRFSSSLGLNPDGSGNEEFGTVPDVVCEPGEDALEKCLEMLEEYFGD